MAKKYVYYFGGKKADGDAKMRELLGGKGANLAEMINLGLPVPPGFTLTTELCNYFYNNSESYPKSLPAELQKAIKKVEKEMGSEFGSTTNPLLFSVRSGARASMPGMMDTVLNLGLNDKTVKALAKKSDNEKFAYDSYRRFVAMYGDVVLDMKPKSKDDIDPFEEILDAKKKEVGAKLDTDLTVNDLKDLVKKFKAIIKKEKKQVFPEDPWEQLWGAIGAVFGSWHNERANLYRRLNNIPDDWGTAVNVQAMVYGNLGEDSGTGVAFTRDAATGANVFYGEFLMNAQGEDVVAGVRTPQVINDLVEKDEDSHNKLLEIREILEDHFKDMMDIEFTIQDGKLYMLQCRVGKRTALASIKIAIDMVKEKRIKPKEALLRIEADKLDQLLRPIFDQKEKAKALSDKKLVAKGLNAGPGAASGKVVFHAEDAVELARKGIECILVRIETSPEDISGMNAAEGILTARGGMTSHAALIARQMGKVCVAGCGSLHIDYKSRKIKIEGSRRVIKEGDWISIDGSTGEVIIGKLETKPSEVVQVLIDKTMDPQDAEIYQMFEQIMTWSDQYRKLGIRTNADQPDQCENALAFGAEGVGLTRTEHMFFGEGKIKPMRQMILAKNSEERFKALNKLMPLQKLDFKGIFHVMDGKPTTIRLIDPPFHEFLPQDIEDQKHLAKELNLSLKDVHDRIEFLHEFNPMLGFRGVRLTTVYPEITEMQSKAIFEAAAEVIKTGKKVFPEIMIPLVGNYKEFEIQEKIVRSVASDVQEKFNVEIPYMLGTMMEIPRGAITADKIAEKAEFFSFGTNDLTQTVMGLSRDDSGSFLPEYINKGIYKKDPFEAIDQEGVGFLMKHATKKARKVRKNIQLGICGEHGGEPSSVEFCHRIGLDYVSCSPFRVPIARLAAAHAALKNKGKKNEL